MRQNVFKFTRRERSHDCHRRRLKGFTWILHTLACHETAAAAAAAARGAQLSRSPRAGPPQNGILGSTCIYECVTLTYLSLV